MNYKRPGLQAHAVIQNGAVWGMKGNQSLNLYEGWVKLTAPCGLFAQVGRVALAYDDERIVGPNDFAMAAASHDIVRVGYEGHGHKAHVILAYNQNGDNVYSGTYYDNGLQFYKTMQTVWYHYDVLKIPLGMVFAVYFTTFVHYKMVVKCNLSKIGKKSDLRTVCEHKCLICVKNEAFFCVF